MAFFNRLFNRKSKTELVSSPTQQSLRRSLTDPQPSTPSPVRGRRSSSDDRDTIEMLPAPRMVASRPRRAGCDLGRSKTSVEVGSVRSSTSSAAEPASSSADGSKSQYRQMRALHRSRLHTIMAAQDRTTKRGVVLKAFLKSRLSSSLRAKLESEVNVLRDLAGVPGVVQFITQFEDDDAIYIVMERCPGPTLIELIANSGGRLPEAVLVPDVLIPLTLLLVDLHRRGVVHRQLKPEHVILGSAAPATAAADGRAATAAAGDGLIAAAVAALGGVAAGASAAAAGAVSWGVTLVDFSEAVNKNQRCLNNRAGAMEYMAPEVLGKPTAEEVFHQVLYNGMSEEELPQYDEKADIWSLGALVFEALTGCQPFLADSPADMARMQRALLTDPDPATGLPALFAGRPQLSAEARSFLLAALQLDPINRTSAERLLQHPLLQKYWTAYQAKAAAAARRADAAAGEAGAGRGRRRGRGRGRGRGGGGCRCRHRYPGAGKRPVSNGGGGGGGGSGRRGGSGVSYCGGRLGVLRGAGGCAEGEFTGDGAAAVSGAVAGRAGAVAVPAPGAFGNAATPERATAAAVETVRAAVASKAVAPGFVALFATATAKDEAGTRANRGGGGFGGGRWRIRAVVRRVLFGSGGPGAGARPTRRG